MKLDTAIEICDGEETNQTIVDTAVTELKAAYEALVRVDKKALKETITEVNGLVIYKENYTTDSYAAYEKAYNHAVSVRDNAESVQEEVDRAEKELIAAYKDLAELADKSELIELVNEITKANIREEYYTAGSYALFQTKLNEAKAIVNREESDQSLINTILDELTDAYESLVEADKTVLNSTIAQMEKISGDKYKADSYQQLQTALTEAKKIQSDKEATQRMIDDAVNQLVAAKESLVENPVVDKKALSNKITEAEKLKKSDYVEESYQELLDALENAKEALNSAEVTQEEIDDALEELVTAVEGLEEITYTITYKLKGGKNDSDNPESYRDGEEIELQDAKRKGYSFEGWYTDSKFKKKLTTIKENARKDYTLYAKWKKITVKKASIKSVKNLSGKKARITIKKFSEADGYQITYSTNQKFAKFATKNVNTRKTSMLLKKLKNKKYYVKIRAYIEDSTGKKVYGQYSEVKVVTIKK